MSTWRCLEPLPVTVTTRRAEVHVADVEAAQLGHPQPAPVEQLEHGVVPAIDLGRGPGNGVAAGRLQQLVQLGVAEDPGQPGVGCRRRQAGRRVGVDQAPLAHHRKYDRSEAAVRAMVALE